ncbi:hypothetical protein OAO01_07415 [Oligoflexia bacterium]|nr:hypothetical protein [Oligoflexia bacterium]
MEEIVSNKTCAECSQTFPIYTKDIGFYKKIDVAEPVRCPECRHQMRALHVNQLHLFKRKCDATGVDIISNYLPDSPYTVYEQAYWYGEGWDAVRYGREFDFSRSFFDQYYELGLEVPRPALFTDYLKDENCEYTNYAGKNRDCYQGFMKTKDVMDFDEIGDAELAYECAELGYNGYNLRFCLQRNPRNLWERNCEGCGLELHSSYAPARPEKIYCEECYLEQVM